MKITRLLILFCIACCSPVFGQTEVSLFDTLYALKDVRLTLTYPFDSLYKTNKEEITAAISIETSEGVMLRNEPMALNLRGKFRRMKCSMPPLLLNFKKSTLHRLQLKSIDEMKLVTHCLSTPEGEENLEEERLCYQLYEALTPYSYRTIWVTVTYVDSLHQNKPITASGFLLEPDKDISHRLGVIERKLFNLTQDSLDMESYGRAAAFNFLIGNRDWSVVMSRNAKLFFAQEKGKYVVLPYDFDYSNLVSPSYRRETRPADMTNALDRIYQGEYFADQAGAILKSFSASRSILMSQLTTASNPISDGKRRNIARYFDAWFTYIEKNPASALTYNTIIPYTGGL